ncbi:MAG: rod shape-determining protein [Thermoanaerobaculia bacterium]
MRVLDVLRPPLVAIDVGTATTRIRFDGGVVHESPSIVTEQVDGEPVGRPTMRSGVVADIAGVASVLGGLLDGRRRLWQRRPGGVVCAPTDVTDDERDALIEAVSEAGASVVAVVPEPLAAIVSSVSDRSCRCSSTQSRTAQRRDPRRQRDAEEPVAARGLRASGERLRGTMTTRRRPGDMDGGRQF